MAARLLTNVMVWDGFSDAAFAGEVLVEGNRIKAVARGRNQIATEQLVSRHDREQHVPLLSQGPGDRLASRFQLDHDVPNPQGLDTRRILSGTHCRTIGHRQVPGR